MIKKKSNMFTFLPEVFVWFVEKSDNKALLLFDFKSPPRILETAPGTYSPAIARLSATIGVKKA